MRIYPKWKVSVIDNRVRFQDREEFDRHLLVYEGKENMELVIKPITKARSRQEEKYYRAVVCRMVAAEMGISEEEAHKFMARLFLTITDTKMLNDKIIRYERIRSSTELDDKQFDDYIFKDCVPWAALPTQDEGLSQESGLGLYIPLPNEIDYDY